MIGELPVRSTADIRYYLYVSKTKLEMLYSQLDVPQSEKKGLEWSVNLGAFKIKRNTENKREPYMETKLDAVVKELEDAGQIGTIDEPREYFQGALPDMHWGFYDENGRPDNEAPLVYFAGHTEETIFGLGGSSKHVIGYEGAGHTHSRSVTPFLVAHLLAGLEMSPEGWHYAPFYYEDADTHNYQTFEAIGLANYKLRKTPDQPLKFLAKTLLQGSITHPVVTHDKRMKCLLGTPLYVQLTGPQPPDEAWDD